MPRQSFPMNSQASTAAYDSRFAAPKTTGFDRGEALRNARITVPFALGFLALAASFVGPAEVHGPLLNASVIICFLIGLSSASNNTTVRRAR